MKSKGAGKLFVAIACLSGLCVGQAQAHTLTYVVDDPKGRDNVTFNSDAPIEVINGVTHKIKGTINIDDSLDTSRKPFEAQFTVDLASIDTGIALRNEHMQKNFLETDKYPTAVFKVSSVIGKHLEDGKTETLEATGEFSLHGKTVKRQIPVSVTYFKQCKSTDGKFPNCDLIQIKSTFPVPFKDYNIKRPEIVFQKLADTVFVTVSATARRELDQAKAKPH